MALDLYDQAYPYLNGALVSEATAVQFGLVGDNQRVLTIAKGFAGITPSPKMVEIKVENVVPITGIEVDVQNYFLESIIVTHKLQFGGNGQKYEGKGFIMDFSLDSGVGKTTTMSYTFVGEPKAVE
jgi:hypothetical protein